jgi:hypothetical protein
MVDLLVVDLVVQLVVSLEYEMVEMKVVEMVD